MSFARIPAAAMRTFRQFGRIRDFAATLATEFVILGATLLVFRLAAKYWGTTGFGEYVLFRRNIGLLQLPLSFSVAIGITRYIARARSHGEFEQPYIVAALRVVASTVGAAAIVGGVFSSVTARLLFGSAQYGMLAIAVIVAVAGSVMHSIAYGVFRGRLAMRRANTLQFVNIALVPLIIFSRPGLSVEQVAFGTGFLWIIISAISIVIVLRTEGRVGKPVTVSDATMTLLRYGIPRVPGEFALAALFALPATITAHISGVAAAGFVGFAISLLTAIASAFTPLGLIVLPSVSSRVASGDVAQLRRDTFRVMAVCIAAAACGVAIIEVATPAIVLRGLGQTFDAAIPIVRLVLAAAVPYVCYIVLRNVLDGAHTRAINAKNLVISLAVFCGAASLLKTSFLGTALALVAAVTLAGVLTTIDTWRVLGRLRTVPTGD